MLAARTGSTDVASALIAAGADVNAREAWRDQTALMWAAEGAFPELVELAHRARRRRARARRGQRLGLADHERAARAVPPDGRPDAAALCRALGLHASACSAILAAGEAVDRPTPDGVTALMLAIDNYEFDTAKALLDAGANPHLWDWWGRTALYLAVDMNTLRAARRRRAPALDEHDRHGPRARAARRRRRGESAAELPPPRARRQQRALRRRPADDRRDAAAARRDHARRRGDARAARGGRAASTCRTSWA